jgi:hypothetical protein
VLGLRAGAAMMRAFNDPPIHDEFMRREGWQRTHEHRYPNADGELVFIKLRYQRPDKDDPKGYEKTCRFIRPVGNGWEWRLGDGERPLYRLKDVLAAPPDAMIYILESEKVCDFLADEGRVATCVATTWEGVDIAPLRGRPLAVLVDNDVDGTGTKKASDAIEALKDVAGSIRRVFGGPPSGNLADRLHEEHGDLSLDEFDAAVLRVKALELEPGDPPSEPFETFDAADWKGVPVEPERYLVRNRIPLGEPGIISGDGGVGKTILILQLAVPVGLDRPDWPDWVGGVIEDFGPMLLFSAEEKLKRLHPRVDRILASRGLSFDDVGRGRLNFICDHKNDPVLATVDRKSGLVTPTASLLRLERNVALLRPRLIVIENASDVFGGNAIDPTAVKRFVTHFLGGLCAISGATLVLIQHPSVSGLKEGSGRGGTMQWRNGGRCFLNFVQLTKKKTNDSDNDDTGDDGGEEEARSGDSLRELIVHKNNYGRRASG